MLSQSRLSLSTMAISSRCSSYLYPSTERLDNILVPVRPPVTHLLRRHREAKERLWQFGLKLDGVDEKVQNLFKQLVRKVEKEAGIDDSIAAFVGHWCKRSGFVLVTLPTQRLKSR